MDSDSDRCECRTRKFKVGTSITLSYEETEDLRKRLHDALLPAIEALRRERLEAQAMSSQLLLK